METAITNPPVKEKAKKEDVNLRDEVLLGIYKEMQEMKAKQAPDPVPAQIINEVPAIIEKPRRIVFQVKGFTDENAMRDGAYLPSKSMGIVCNSMLQSELLNTNLYWQDRTLDRWRTGFEVEEIMDNPSLSEEEKQKLAKEVKIARIYLEHKFKQSLGDDNPSMWRGKKITIGDLGRVYDTSKDDVNLLMYYNILGDGHPEIAKSYEICKAKGKKYYLAVYEDEAKRKVEGARGKLRASAKLDEVDLNWGNEDLLYLLYALPGIKSLGFSYSTPRDTIVNELLDYINAVDTKTDKKKRPQQFLDTASLFSSDPDYVKISAIIEAAIYYGFINQDKQKSYTNRQTGFNYGSSKQTAISKMLEIKNIDELTYIKTKVLDKWKK